MRKNSKITGFMALMLFGVFATAILMVLLTGADVYQRLAQRDQSVYDRRTAAQYVTTRVRQADRDEGVRVEEFSGLDALVLSEEIEGEFYETRVYCYDGYLCELFTQAGGEFMPEDGERILPVSQFYLDWQSPVLTAQIVFPDGSTQTLVVSLRSMEMD